MLVLLGIIAGLVLIIATIVMSIKLFFMFKKKEEIIVKNKEAGNTSNLFLKKYPEANPQIYRTTFTLIGFIFGIGLSIAAFSWTVYDRTASLGGEIFIPDEFEIEPPQTRQEPPPPPPPPPPPEIEIIDDEVEVDSEPDIFDVEVEPDEIVEIQEIFEELPDEDDMPLPIVEDMPVFPGGEAALLRYLGGIPYPEIAKQNDIEGSVFIRFVIERDGRVTEAEVVRGADRVLNEAALRHVRNMPNWKPGKQRGQPVRVQFTVPIRFTLD
ncbi:MAG: energy transducer TonB [Chitinophagaceae bacterium]|nr:MAG: energy transducer TonB [Chitinophagaceae bacterium]